MHCSSSDGKLSVRNNLLLELQAVYWHGRSTESALLNVLSNIIDSIDKDSLALLAFINLSTAFDIVDHDLMQKRLVRSFGFDGTSVQWIASYLTNRTQSVQCQSTSHRKILNRSWSWTLRFSPQAIVIFVVYGWRRHPCSCACRRYTAVFLLSATWKCNIKVMCYIVYQRHFLLDGLQLTQAQSGKIKIPLAHKSPSPYEDNCIFHLEDGDVKIIR